VRIRRAISILSVQPCLLYLACQSCLPGCLSCLSWLCPDLSGRQWGGARFFLNTVARLFFDAPAIFSAPCLDRRSGKD